MSTERFWFSAKMRENELYNIGGKNTHTEVMDTLGAWRTYTVMNSSGNGHDCAWDDLVEISPMLPIRLRINGVVQYSRP